VWASLLELVRSITGAKWSLDCRSCLEATAPLRMAALSIVLSLLVVAVG
jgi:hypothetical protein